MVVSNSAGSVTSSAATEHLALSADQQAYENFALSPSAGIYEVDWSLNYVGAQTPASSLWFVDQFAIVSVSPLTHGLQLSQEQPEAQIATTLGTPPVAPTRILRNGAILVVPDRQGWFSVSYVGSGIHVDELAADGSTVAYSEMRSN